METPGGTPTAASTIDSRLLAGQLIGDKYRVSHLLGAGGMASVWAGTNERTGKLVALKVIRRSFMATPGAEIFLQTEGLAASRVNHPNVVSVFDLIEHEGMACIVMELLDGVSLGNYVAAHKPLSLFDAVGILLPAMRGVASAHSQGVIHRDLKPQNIFVCVDADGRVVTSKVLDFGISRMMDWARGQSVAAMPGLVGTPSYMSPEHIEGSTEHDPRTDVYGFGLLLYETLSGTPAFPYGPNVDEVLQRVLTETPVPLSQLRPDLPEGITSIVEMAMAKRPEARFERLSQMIAAIEDQMSQLSMPVVAGASAPSANMSYSLSGPLAVGIPSQMSREASEPHVIPSQGQAKRENERGAPRHEIHDKTTRRVLVGNGTPEPMSPQSVAALGKAAGRPAPAPTVLLARAIISRSVRDLSNHHYLARLREHRILRILIPSGAVLILVLIVWGMMRGSGAHRPEAARPAAQIAPPRIIVTPLPPTASGPAAGTVENASITPESAQEAANRPPGTLEDGDKRAQGKSRHGGKVRGKHKGAGDGQDSRRAGGLRVDDF